MMDEDQQNQLQTHHDNIVQLTAFKVGDEEYVVDILRIREIIRPQPVTPVRRGPRFCEGVITLRGSVIPVVDMRRRFGLPPLESESSKRRVIILVIDGRVLGLMVDAVTEVVRLPRTLIRPAPGLLDHEKAPYFMGVCNYRERLLILLNVRSIVESDDDIDLLSPEALMADEV
ncbi:MAG: chemotaxis protein CheW [Myxococcota bacterium]|nr:chemotaxis protein CheW [Myxococcota bacterium]